jgi:hypothetical protein
MFSSVFPDSNNLKNIRKVVRIQQFIPPDSILVFEIEVLDAKSP